MLVLDTEQVVFPQLLQTSLSGGRRLAVFSGVALVDLKADAAHAWSRDTLILALNTTRISAGARRKFVHDQAAPLVTLNSVWGKNAVVSAGFAVDSCRALPHIELFRDWILIVCEIAARDKDAFLYRAGYHVTVTGKVIDSDLAGVKPSQRTLAREMKKLQDVAN
jgi:hypothetical protein